MAEITLVANSIGSLARKIISQERSAAILGVTSRGLFLRVGLHWVIFLSYEAVRGPLTLNLNRPIPISKEQIHLVEIRNDGIYFPDQNTAILTGNAEEWDIPSTPQPILTSYERNQRIADVVQEITSQREKVGFMPLLGELLHLDFARQPSPAATVDQGVIVAMNHLVRSTDENQLITHLQPFIGLGSGLTPSGDDLISGVLLTLNRYHETLSPQFSLPSLNKTMVELAYQHTSLLSANLVECASLGMADERLILALDGMLTGALDVASCANLLISWGNTSGCDALVGMAAAAYQT